jgi:hypothetical protein
VYKKELTSVGDLWQGLWQNVVPDGGLLRLKVGGRRLEVGGRRLEVGGRRLEVGGPTCMLA